MKVLLVNGSPHAKGSTYTALHEMEKIFEENGIEAEIVHVGNQDIRGCVACSACSKLGKCAFSDMVNEVAPKFEEADGIVVGSPVYYASANATLIAFLDRKLWVTGEAVLGNRVGHAVDDDVVILRRAADREKHRRVISPDSGVSLPNNLAVIIPLEGGHLRALLPDARGRITAVKRKFHEKHLRKCRFRRKYSRHEAKNPA